MAVIDTVDVNTTSTMPRLLSISLQSSERKRDAVYWHICRDPKGKAALLNSIDDDVTTIAHMLAIKHKMPVMNAKRCVEYVGGTFAWALRYRANITVYPGFITFRKSSVLLDKLFRKELIAHKSAVYPELIVTDRTVLWGEVLCDDEELPVRKCRFARQLQDYVKRYGLMGVDVWSSISTMMGKLLIQRGRFHVPNMLFTLCTAVDNTPPVLGIQDFLLTQETPTTFENLTDMISEQQARKEDYHVEAALRDEREYIAAIEKVKREITGDRPLVLL